MNFGEIIHTAQRNGQTDRKEIKYYNTKFEPPKKEQRSKTLSVNVQKFLAKKEEEEKKKRMEAQKRRDQLLALRSKDKKATRRVNVMLKRTKSANQSVIQDAVDDDNTAVTLVGPSQPDEDDYGYVSQSAAEYYNKMMEKYNKMPDEPKFKLEGKRVSTNLNNTKDRVKAALDKERDDALLPHRRKRKSDGSSVSGANKEESENDPYVPKKEEKSKPKLKAAPVINFNDLLKMAAKKQHEPIVIEKKEKEEERLLTKRQRREMEKEREFREGRERREQLRLQEPPNKIPKLNPEVKKMNGMSDRIPKANGYEKPIGQSNGSKLKQALTKDNKLPGFKKPEMKNQQADKSKPNCSSKDLSKSKSDVRPRSAIDKPSGSNGLKPVKDLKPREFPTTDLKPRQFPPNDLKPKQFPPNDLKRKPPPSNGMRPKQFPPNDLRPKQFPPSDLRPKQFPPSDLRPKQFPPADVRRGHPAGVKRKPLISKGRFYDDDDSEYDSEMDDFIDDGPDEEEDYSKAISEIFGYDKKKYRYVDEDDDNMETTFAQQMKEECISAKIGIMEDLEDMKLEEEHKRKKALMKKRSQKY